MIELDDGRTWKRHIDQLKPGPVIQQTQPEIQIPTDTSRRSELITSSPVGQPVQPKVEPDDINPTLDISDDSDEDNEITENTGQRTPTSTMVRDTGAGSGSNINRSVKSRTSIQTACDTVHRSVRERRPPRRLDL